MFDPAGIENVDATRQKFETVCRREIINEFEGVLFSQFDTNEYFPVLKIDESIQEYMTQLLFILKEL